MCWGRSMFCLKGGGYRGLHMNLRGEGMPGGWVGGGREQVLGQEHVLSERKRL